MELLEKRILADGKIGAGIVIEKTYQGAGIDLRNEGIRVESLARIAKLSVAEGIEFYR